MKNTIKNTMHFALSCFLFLPAVSYYCGMQETQVHGSIGKVTFTTARTEGDVYIVTAEVTFVSREEIRLPVTFTVLGKARTKLVQMNKGENSLSMTVSLENPVKNNPLVFLGSDSTEAIVRIDGQTVSQEVRFS